MRLVAALAVSALSFTPSFAADYLRGPLPEPAAKAGIASAMDWSGFYAGGHFNYGATTVNNASLANSTSITGISDTQVQSAVLAGTAFGNANGRNGGFGGYLGYNTMWDDVVLGLEGEYTSAKARATSRAFISGTQAATGSATDAYTYDTVVTGRTTINDYFALKARAGWAIDRTLLYASLGVARATVERETFNNGTWERYIIAPRSTVSGVTSIAGATKQTLTKWGFVAGLGAEYALTDNIILRGEWQYLGVGSSGTATAPKDGYFTMNSVRAGANVKF